MVPTKPWDDDVIQSFCHHVLYFVSEEAGRRWVPAHPRTFLLPVEQAFEVGRRFDLGRFGAALGTPPERASSGREAAAPAPASSREEHSSSAGEQPPRHKEPGMPTVIDRDHVRHLVEQEAAQLVEVLPRAEYDEEHLARLSWLSEEARAKLLVSGHFRGARVYYLTARPVAGQAGGGRDSKPSMLAVL